MRAIIHLMPASLRREFIFLEEKGVAEIVDRYKNGEFAKHKEIHVSTDTARASASECFDLTNNPGRQEERELVYGNGRSISVGDVIEVEDRHNPEKTTAWLCKSFGWEQIA